MECKNPATTAQLSLYERMALSRDKDKVYLLSQEGNTVAEPKDIIKDPYVLEFVGLDEKAEYTESVVGGKRDEEMFIENVKEPTKVEVKIKL